MDNIQKKALALCHSGDYGKAWAYWKLMGYDYGIFLGEVSASEFITGDDLANSIGLTAGTSQYYDTPWLKFAYNGELIYIPKKPLRHSVSWRSIYQAGAVYGTNDYGSVPSGGNRIQDASVTIGGYDFKVTLLRGANNDHFPNTSGYDPSSTHSSEWNKLMYPIHSGIHTNSGNPSSGSVPFNQWSSYSDEDLLIDYIYGNGTRVWTQETCSTIGKTIGNTMSLYRGCFGITSCRRYTTTYAINGTGWRPSLRFKL